MVQMFSPVLGFQTFRVQSSEHETILFPSGVKLAHVTSAPWPPKVVNWPSSIFHIQTRVSFEAARTKLPLECQCAKLMSP